MGVLRKPQRLEAALFDDLAKITWRDAVVGRKHRDPELHHVTPFSHSRLVDHSSHYAAAARAARRGKTRARNQLPNSAVRLRGSSTCISIPSFHAISRRVGSRSSVRNSTIMERRL